MMQLIIITKITMRSNHLEKLRNYKKSVKQKENGY